MSLSRTTIHKASNAIRPPVCIQCRSLHKRAVKPVPTPTPFVPDTEAFLTLIGRKSSAHASKIPSWDALFSLSSEQLRASGVEPARARRYILWWRDRYRNGIMGIGGDLKKVVDGVAELKIVQMKSQRKLDQQATLTKDAGMRKVIINTAPSAAAVAEGAEESQTSTTPGLMTLDTIDATTVESIAGIKIGPGDVIAGKGVEYIKGQPGVARLRVKEGLWEQERGHKVDGGERRKAEVRAKRRAAERNTR